MSHNLGGNSGSSGSRTNGGSAIVFEAIRDHFQRRTFRKRQRLGSTETGPLASRLHVVMRGAVRLVQTAEVGSKSKQRVMDLIGPGMFFGHMSLAEIPTQGPMVAIAEGGSEIWSIELDDFMTLLRKNGTLSTEYAQLLVRQNAIGTGLRSDIASLGVVARIASSLSLLTHYYGVVESDGRRVLSCVSQQDLADLLGASRSFVSTVINVLKRRNVLEGDGRRLAILAPTELQKLAKGVLDEADFHGKKKGTDGGDGDGPWSADE